jgi:hypothetical protein
MDKFIKENLHVKVDTVALLNEIQKNAIHPKDMAALKIPFGYFRTLLHAVADRATEIDDDQLNKLMLLLSLYSVSQPNSPEYDESVVNASLSKVSGGWTKPSEHLPMHEQDCIVCRLVDGQCRVYQSQYYAGQIIQGFGDLDDGESFYDDVLYWMPINMADIYAELDKENDCE